MKYGFELFREGSFEIFKISVLAFGKRILVLIVIFEKTLFCRPLSHPATWPWKYFAGFLEGMIIIELSKNVKLWKLKRVED